MAVNGRLKPTGEQLAGIALLARALGNGSEKLAAAIFLVYGGDNARHLRAKKVDMQLQPFVTDLIADHANPSILEGGAV